ncbi:MAG: hypothetical protein NTV72_02360 [Candidatus Taylorbacteria bacterium]|nr:hypothetical protein [Candidatus Taylorbacteria bacterium]
MDIISIFTFFGFTPQNLTPLVVIGVLVIFVVYKYIAPIKESLQEIREKFFVFESRVSDLWKDKLAPSGSPRQLNERGREILEQSGIKEIIEIKEEKIIELIKAKNPKTAFDAEKILLDIIAELPNHCPEIMDSLKNGAFRVGADIPALLFVAGIDLRDKIFPSLGFKIEDIDRKEMAGNV